MVWTEKSSDLARDLRPYELLGMMEAGLDEVRKVVVLGGTDEARDGDAGERAAPRVQVVQQHLHQHIIGPRINLT